MRLSSGMAPSPLRIPFPGLPRGIRWVRSPPGTGSSTGAGADSNRTRSCSGSAATGSARPFFVATQPVAPEAKTPGAVLIGCTGGLAERPGQFGLHAGFRARGGTVRPARRRQELTPSLLHLGSTVWNAMCAPDPQAVAALAGQDLADPSLPSLAKDSASISASFPRLPMDWGSAKNERWPRLLMHPQRLNTAYHSFKRGEGRTLDYRPDVCGPTPWPEWRPGTVGRMERRRSELSVAPR